MIKITLSTLLPPTCVGKTRAARNILSGSSFAPHVCGEDPS